MPRPLPQPSDYLAPAGHEWWVGCELASYAPRGRLLLGLAVVRLSRLHDNCEIALQAFPGVVDWHGRIRFARQHRDFAARADF
jgi:hypothetical protein